MLDEGILLGLVHEPDSPTMVEEVSRRIDFYLRERARDMDEIVRQLRRSGLDDWDYGIYKREMSNL